MLCILFGFLRLARDDDDDLQLVFLKVLGSERHNELSDCRVNATDNDMVLDLRIILK